jgi:hypothetical protein
MTGGIFVVSGQTATRLHTVAPLFWLCTLPTHTLHCLQWSFSARVPPVFSSLQAPHPVTC